MTSSPRTGRVLQTGLRAILLLVISLWVLVPVYFLVLTSFVPDKVRLDGFTVPSQFTLDNYYKVFTGENAIWPAMANSTVVTVAATLLSLAIATPAAYALSHLRGRKLGRGLYLCFFVLRGIPPISLVLPLYLIFAKASLLDTLPGLIIAMAPLALPYCVWMLRVTFDQIPREVEEAAVVDGADAWRTFRSVVLPIATPSIAATGLLAALFIYVDFIIVSALAGPSTYTFPVYITTFKQDYITLIGPMAAAALIGAIPMALLFIFSQGLSKRLASAGIH